MKDIDIERDSFTFDELDGLLAEAPLEEAHMHIAKSALPEPGTILHSQYRSLLRSFIKSAEAEGISVTVNVDPDQPPVHADFRPVRPAKPDFSQIFADAPPERRAPITPISEEQLATLLDLDAPEGETREHAAVVAAAEAIEVVPRRSIRERWQEYRQNRREARAKRAHPGLYRAVGVVATVSLLVGGGLFAKSVIPEASARQDTATATAPSSPETTQPNTTSTTTPTTESSTEQAGPQLTEDQAKAVITISTGRYFFEQAHPELTQVQVDQQYMAAVDYAVVVQGASSVQS